MSRLTTILLFVFIYFCSIVILIPFVILNNDPKTGDFLIFLLGGLFGGELVVYTTVVTFIKFIIKILERR
jgi:hypothetical protein